jgi:hypothetical protein
MTRVAVATPTHPRAFASCHDGAPDVFGVSDGFQVRRVHAPVDAAEMVELETVRNRADGEEVRKPVSEADTLTVVQIVAPAVAGGIGVS